MTGNKHAISNKSPTVYPPPSIDRLLRWPDVQPLVGLCRSHVHQLIAEGKFPAQVKIVEGGRASAWPESSIRAWIEQRATASRLANPEAPQGEG